MAYAGKAGEEQRINAMSKSVRYKRPRPLGALLTGLTIGLLVGAGLALLYAPQEGSETRHDLRRRLRRFGARGEDAWDGLRTELWRARRRYRRAKRRRELELAEQKASEA